MSTTTRTIAVVAHREKTLGGGLGELRDTLRRQGAGEPMWFEVTKSKRAPARVRQALADGADLVFVWGGDGMVQRCADVMADSGVPLAVVPAGTANLLARNLGIPQDIERAVAIGLGDHRRLLDLGVVNGERFAVMAGAGFDAAIMREVDGSAKSRFGRVAYLWSGARQLRRGGTHGRVKVDGVTVFGGDISCVLVGNVGSLFGGVTVFSDAEPDDGRLDIAVVSAGRMREWLGILWRAARGNPEASPFVRMYRGSSVRAKFDHKVPYELDGGDRGKTTKLRVDVAPHALVLCVDENGNGNGNGNGAA
jgi:diacylglycerol kinase family enzyme